MNIFAYKDKAEIEFELGEEVEIVKENEEYKIKSVYGKEISNKVMLEYEENPNKVVLIDKERGKIVEKIISSINGIVYKIKTTIESNKNIKDLPEDKYMKIQLELNFNDKCVEFVEKGLKEENVDVSFKAVKNKLCAIYKESIIATSNFNIENSINLDDINYEINDLFINVNIPIILLKDCNSLLENLYKKSKKYNYDEYKIDYMMKCGLSFELIDNVLEIVHSTERVNIKPKTLYIDDGIKVKACILKILNGGHIRLFGGKGTGKNTLVDTVAWLLERKVYKFPGSPQNDKSDLIGDVTLVNVEDSNGKSMVITKFQESILIKAMKSGAILLLDEININDSSTTVILNGPMDDSRYINCSELGDVYAHENFVVIATMNENYVGTQKLNQALVDRMIGINFETPKTISNILSVKRPGATKEILNYIDNIYSKIVTLVADEVIDDSALTLRGFIDIIDFVEGGVDLDDAIEISVINRIQDMDYRNIVKTAIKVC